MQKLTVKRAVLGLLSLFLATLLLISTHPTSLIFTLFRLSYNDFVNNWLNVLFMSITLLTALIGFVLIVLNIVGLLYFNDNTYKIIQIITIVCTIGSAALQLIIGTSLTLKEYLQYMEYVNIYTDIINIIISNILSYLRWLVIDVLFTIAYFVSYNKIPVNSDAN